jgi:radical SAM superfamily enzyme YgiQ (UPF0313 family)
VRIALISPRSPRLSRDPEFESFVRQSPQMEFYRQYWSGLGSGLLVIAALTPPEIELELINEDSEDINFERDYDLVGITAVTQQATRAYEISRKFRERGIKVVLGGIHTTVMPDEARLHADSIVVGEAENLWPKLLDDFRYGCLSPVYTSEQQVNLTESTLPRYELLRDKPAKIIWVQATRGCPHDCMFCCASRVYGTSYRRKSISQVIAEIKEVQRIKKHALVGFADDNLLCDKEYSRQLLERVAEQDIKWIGQTDISIADDESLLKLVKRSGCVALLIGFESIAADNLKGLDSTDWKLKHLRNYAKNIAKIQSHGIGIIGTFIVGLDHDYNSTFDRLANFIIGNHLAGAQIAALTPFPQTRVREDLLKENRILDTPWENYTLYDVNIIPKNMSPEELRAGILNMFKRVYSPEVAERKQRHFKQIFATANQPNDDPGA